MTRRWFGAAVLVLIAAACNGDDDDAVESSVAETTAAPATSPPETTEATTTTESTTTTAEATTTTVDVESLKAEIAEDYLRSWELRRELTENPTLDGLDERLAQISAPRSEDYTNLQSFVNELVTLGERVVAGTPDEYRIDVERVDLLGEPPHTEAVVTICFIRNRVRVDAAGNVVLDSGIVASRSEDHVVLTSNGWLPDRGFEDTWQGLGVTQCPAP